MTARRRPLDLLLLLASLAGAPGPALAKPEWAKPYLGLPTPEGAYIAKSDAWAIVREEIEAALTEKTTIETRYRILYEHLSDRPEYFSTSIPCDEDRYELVEPTLYVQRGIWHKINLTKKADKLTFKEVARTIVASAEDIEPHTKVYLEFTLRDKLGFLPYQPLFIPQSEPTAKLRFTVDPASAQRGLVFEVRRPSGETLPSSFVQEPDGSWTVSDVPALRRITTADLNYQPAYHDLFPYF